MHSTKNKTLTRHMARTDQDLGILGYGCMRFSRKYGTVVDLEKAERQVLAAIEGGVNYFDTAYIYPGNEEAIGTILAKSDNGQRRRERVNLATKLPIMMVKSREDMDAFLGKSLSRLKTDYVDYYLMHSINCWGDWERVKQLGVLDFIEQVQRDGRVRHIGFSWHGNLNDFKRVVDDYPWAFCQIQYNYLDENFQAGTEGLHYAAEKGLGVIVMEPLRGGMLIDKMPVQVKKIIQAYNAETGLERSPAEWGLRWVWNHPEVTLLLSGMNEDAHVAENLRVAADTVPGSLSDADLAMIASARAVFEARLKVGCTGCSYCMPCPHHVDIPQCFAHYNSWAMFGGLTTVVSYAFAMRGRKGPFGASHCKRCGACERKCPQNIPIMDMLSAMSKDMEKWWVRALSRLAGVFVKS